MGVSRELRDEKRHTKVVDNLKLRKGVFCGIHITYYIMAGWNLEVGGTLGAFNTLYKTMEEGYL